MAENPDRFVIIDGVQVSRERAKRKGLLDADGNPRQNRPAESRARTEQSARRPGSGGAHVAAAPAAPVVTAQVGDGAVSVGEDAQRAGAADPGAPASVPAGTPEAPAAAAPVVATGDGSDAGAAEAAGAAAAAATGDPSTAATGDGSDAASDAGAAKATPAKIRRR